MNRSTNSLPSFIQAHKNFSSLNIGQNGPVDALQDLKNSKKFLDEYYEQLRTKETKSHEKHHIKTFPRDETVSQFVLTENVLPMKPVELNPKKPNKRLKITYANSQRQYEISLNGLPDEICSQIISALDLQRK